ncbi:unnamed protein product [Lactuca saligna]|uniref:Uncharacterized protein n=1 Tax=Lactuca saligna TaxID=75948 RepID=A0AA35Z1X9_LACSI|nr:unnamed protein product [Lactuca saligna]
MKSGRLNLNGRIYLSIKTFLCLSCNLKSRLDNDELSPEQVNNVKDFIDDYVERNQEDFDEFEDVDMLYNTLSLDKVEALEDLVIMQPLVMCLGEGLDGGLNGACTKARKWILDHGGVTTIPSWGKTWLSILGVCEWEGTNPMPPEFWHLPSLLPMYPS